MAISCEQELNSWQLHWAGTYSTLAPEHGHGTPSLAAAQLLAAVLA
jgi:hypothetical protein